MSDRACHSAGADVMVPSSAIRTEILSELGNLARQDLTAHKKVQDAFNKRVNEVV
jgi:hypothetical protein